MKIKLLPILLVLFTCLVHAEDKKDMPVCLLTGFDPFGGADRNPSWDAIERLQGTELNGFRIECVQLPVVYDEMAKPLEEAIQKFKPRAVICFGQGGPVFSVETIALNGYNKNKYPDNKGKPPSREEIIPKGKASLETSLPAEKIVEALNAAKYHAILSKNAGGYLCNECFYRLMAVPRGKIDPDPTPAGVGQEQPDRALICRGFVHVPILNSKNNLGGSGDLFTLCIIELGVRVVIDETLKSLAPRYSK